MNYRYKKYQVFRKKLAVPQEVLKRIYNNSATIEDFKNYDLADKIPIDCLSGYYKMIAHIVGIKKALDLDWECILALKDSHVLIHWFKENNEINQTAEELNQSLYKAIKEDFFDMLKKYGDASERLIRPLVKGFYEFNFEILGEKFVQTYPELLYVKQSYRAEDLLFKTLTLGKYIENYDDYVNVPTEFIVESFSNDTDKKLFSFLASSLNSHFIEREKLLLNVVFNARFDYDYENYLDIIGLNPNITIPEFLLQAYRKRIKKQYWVKPKSWPLYEYNYNKIANYTHMNTYDIIGIPEYRKIVLQFVENMPFIANKKFENMEQFIYDLIIHYHLYYDESLPNEFQKTYPELFLNENDSLAIEFYQKRLSPKMIKEHPEYIEKLKDKNITLGFQDFEFIQFIKKIGNDKFLDLCLKYGKYLEPVIFKDDVDNLEKLIENHIETKLKKGQYQFYEDLLQIPTIASKCPEFFLDEGSPEELKLHFYGHDLKAKMLYENPEWCSYLSNKEIKCAIVEGEKNLCDLASKDYLNLCKSYGKYLSEMCLNVYWLNYFKTLEQQKTTLLEVIEEKIYLYIFEGHASYDENMPLSFKEKYPHLFLPTDTPENIKEKFYNRKFFPVDFENNPDWFEYFHNRNIAYYLDKKFSWIIQYKGDIKNENVIKLALAYDKIDDNQFQSVFQDYALNNMEFLSFDKIDLIKDLFFKMSYSNSSELQTCKSSLVKELFQVENPKNSLERIEAIFLKNNLPYIGKVFSVFKILHSNYDFNFSELSPISPILKNIPSNLKNTTMWGENAWRDTIIFSDLVRAALGSNNKSVKDYIENLEMGQKLFLNISSDVLSLEKLNNNELEILRTYTNHLNTLYNNTMIGKKENNILTGNIVKDIEKLIQIFSSNGKLSYDLPDRIIKMYFHFTGFDTLNEVKTYMNKKLEEAEERNRNFAEQDLKIEVGDFIKGIGNIDYLHNILQNGSLAKEFLGASAESDVTPLDTDLSRILESKDTVEKNINSTLASAYGPIYFVLKKDERFIVTREKPDEENKFKSFDSSKIEIFRTLQDNHYGIRTGFASSEINAILMKEYDERVGLEIALNGFYIPVFDFAGKIVFTPKDYDNLRSKMSGLSYYEENNYTFSEEIDGVEVDSILEEQEREKSTLEFYRNSIYKEVSKVLQKYGLSLRNQISSDLSNGTVELIDTGSTGRNTYVPGDIDFDFIMRLDRDILLNNEKLASLKNDLLQAFHQKDSKDVINGQFRLKDAYVEGVSIPLKIDITFLQKTDKVDYSTDLVIQDYLNTIKKQDEEKYKQVIGNIVLAKKVLKDAGCYKAHRSDSTQGGLGGVGIENFILQNGGSFITAAENFLKIAEGKNFEEFKKEYYLWDFGANFLAESRGNYSHDNFVANNMNELGYEKMKEALKKYLDQLQNENNDFLTR